MSQKYDDRYLPATTYQQELTTHKAWKLTKAQYIFYYWLMAHSCWSKGEQHYYIYDNKWTQTAAAHECGITTKTIQRAIPVLEEKKILERVEGAAAYKIMWPYDCAAPVNRHLLLLFIGLGQVVDLPLFIKLYSLLIYGYQHNVANKQFTIIDLERALNLNTGLAEHIKILTMLGLWEHLHLLELEQEEVKVGKRKPYIMYTIKDVKTNLDDVQSYFPDKGIDIKKEWARAAESLTANDIQLLPDD